MQRFWEFILGLDSGFLSRPGEFSIQFNPGWPWQEAVGAASWNLALLALGAVWVWRIYRRDGHAQTARIVLGCLRMALIVFILCLLNRPSLVLTQTRSEPSYLAILLDSSLSMQVRDAGTSPDGQGISRFEAALHLLDNDEQQFLRRLAEKNILRFYSFNRDAVLLGNLAARDLQTDSPTTRPAAWDAVLAKLEPTGQSTQILASLRTVLQDLQGRRVAGVVLLTDGRSTPAESVGENLRALRGGRQAGGAAGFTVPIYPIAVGSEKPARNLAIDALELPDAAFADKDIVAARIRLRTSGFEQGQKVQITLKDKATGLPMRKSDDSPAIETVTVDGTGNQDVEIPFKPGSPGTLQLVAEVARETGEVDYDDNSFPAQLAVLDAKIRVLYVDGYPRWEYRYLKSEMIRAKDVEISCLLLSADSDFAQEGDIPITRFPESMAEMLPYDVVLFGDVDPRMFADLQLQLIAEFVSKKNGGFGMIAGPRWSPYFFRNTPIEAVLPVSFGRNAPPDSGPLTVGWRPVLTRDGEQSTIFRFYEDKDLNEQFLREQMQPLFWYSRGVTAKPGVGEVYAEHPSDLGPDGHKAPIMVVGRYGGGRTLFSAIDDSWRWRFYTGERFFSSYWIGQLRFLARSRKLGQRQFTLAAVKPAYELGQQVQVALRLLDPDLQRQLPDELSVTIVQKNADGTEQPVRQERLQKQEGETELFRVSFTADRAGQFVARVDALVGFGAAAEAPIVMKIPRLELLRPDVDRTTILSRLAEAVEASDNSPDPRALVLPDVSAIPAVRAELAKIPAMAVDVQVIVNQLLWNAPLAMALFVLLVTLEWVLRKAFGML